MTKQPTRQELLDVLQEAAIFIDGLCVGHAVADRQLYELAAKLSRYASTKDDDWMKSACEDEDYANSK